MIPAIDFDGLHLLVAMSPQGRVALMLHHTLLRLGFWKVAMRWSQRAEFT